MPSNATQLALIDIKDNAQFAQALIADLNRDKFRNDRRTFYACVRCLEIISEACRRLDASVMERHPEQPWRKIMDAGNVYRHDYDNIAEDFVWSTITDSLPSLLHVVDEELARLP